MGRASRRKKEVTPDYEFKKRRKAGRRAEERGISIPPTILGYENAARSGDTAVKEGLVSRHNQRMISFNFRDRANYAGIRSYMAPLGHIQLVLKDLGADPDRHPVVPYGKWADHLSWGADSVSSAARLIFSGQLVGAAVILRQQLERWTENVAFNLRAQRRPGQSQADFLTEVWSAVESSRTKEDRNAKGAAFGAPLIPWSGKRAGEIYSALSELAHGRGEYAAIAEWDAAFLFRGVEIDRDAIHAAHRLMVEATALVVRQLRVCTTTFSYEAYKPAGARLVNSLPDALPSGRSAPEPWTLWPLVPHTGLNPETVTRAKIESLLFRRAMRNERPAGRLYQDSELVDLSFADYRFRVMDGALKSLEVEREMLGSLDLESIHARETVYVIASEAAGLLSLWRRGTYQATAAAVAASALRSAYWLWLEDDDRAMAMLRVVLEQIARIRMWRLKKEKAAQLEASPKISPVHWLDKSGLGRLSALSRALGEMSHFRPSIDWLGARELLIDLQPDTWRGSNFEYTGRGAALDRISVLLLEEVADCIDQDSPPIASALRAILTRLGENEAQASQKRDHFFNHVASRKSTHFSASRMSGPAEVHRNVWEIFGKASDKPLTAEESVMIAMAFPHIHDSDVDDDEEW